MASIRSGWTENKECNKELTTNVNITAFMYERESIHLVVIVDVPAPDGKPYVALKVGDVPVAVFTLLVVITD
jgi:hypothetical protein